MCISMSFRKFQFTQLLMLTKLDATPPAILPGRDSTARDRIAILLSTAWKQSGHGTTGQAWWMSQAISCKM